MEDLARPADGTAARFTKSNYRIIDATLDELDSLPSLGPSVLNEDLHSPKLGDEKSDITLYSTEKCRDTAIVFLHGFNGNPRTWLPMISAGRKSGAWNADIVVVDLTSAGIPPSLEGVQMLCEVIMKHLEHSGWNYFHIFGHSTGGSLAAFMASQDGGQKIKSLRIVSGLFVRLFDEARRPLLFGVRLNPTAAALGTLRLLAAFGAVGEVAFHILGRLLPQSNADANNETSSTNTTFSILKVIAQNYTARGARDVIDLGKNYRPALIYPKIAVPVYCAVGTRDPLIGDWDATAVRELLPAVIWSKIEGSGHWTHVERPQAALDAVWPSIKDDADHKQP